MDVWNKDNEMWKEKKMWKIRKIEIFCVGVILSLVNFCFFIVIYCFSCIFLIFFFKL